MKSATYDDCGPERQSPVSLALRRMANSSTIVVVVTRDDGYILCPFRLCERCNRATARPVSLALAKMKSFRRGEIVENSEKAAVKKYRIERYQWRQAII
jgi:hypothetical protein